MASFPLAIKTCNLCGETKKLCNSHLWPKALSKLIKSAETHQFTVFNTEEKSIKIRQNLPFDRNILCPACDRKIGYYDQELKTFIDRFHKAFNSQQDDHLNEGSTINIPIDVEKLEAGLIASIWRLSISKREPNTKIEKRYKDEMKSWLQRGIPSHGFRKKLSIFLHGCPIHEEKDYNFIIPYPCYQQTTEYSCYIFYISGVHIVYIIGNTQVSPWAQIGMVPLHQYSKQVPLMLVSLAGTIAGKTLETLFGST